MSVIPSELQKGLKETFKISKELYEKLKPLQIKYKHLFKKEVMK